MQLNKPKFWSKKYNLFSIILLPLSFLFSILLYIRKKFLKIENFRIVTLCIGNIYLGGTGKTPLSIFLAQELLKRGKKPVILKKYYKNHIDEHNLIKSKTKDIILCHDRIEGINKAINLKYDSVILDDGLQDYRIKKDLSIVCFNSNQLIGNGYILPAGPLREKINALQNVNTIIINGKKNKIFEEKILKINKDLKIFYSQYKPKNLEEFKNKKLLAICGIANPENFLNLIDEYKLNVQKKLIFPDHYKFTSGEINKIIEDANKNSLHIIMTEKDFFKNVIFRKSDVKFLEVSLEIENKDKFINHICEVYGKNN